MLTNPRSERVAAVRSLARRAVRSRRRLFVAEGPQSVREAVTHAPQLVEDLYVTRAAATRHTGVLGAAGGAGVRVVEVTDEVLRAMSDTQTPQGLLAVCRVPAPTLAEVLARRPRLLCVLTHVRDPGNAGTVLRGADAAGADGVVLTDGSVDIFGPKAVRSAAGSHFHVPVVTGVPAGDVIGSLRAVGMTILAADGAGERLLGDVDLRPAHAWVLGNEAWGLAEQLRNSCDAVVRVPVYGQAESLNLAMAATLCLYASAAAQRSSAARLPTGDAPR